jgi:hypothetical protein
MKQKDIAVIAVVVCLAAIVAFIVSNQFLIPRSEKKQTAEVVSAITEEFDVPDNKVFNTEAINPTKLIEIAPNDNNQPFANQQ